MLRNSLSGKNADLNVESEGWRESMRSLSELSRFCIKRGLPFFVFVNRMQARKLTDAVIREISLVGDREGFRVIDVLPWFRDRNPRLLVNSRVDGHPNAEGHSILAQGIKETLISDDLIGEYFSK